jgi:hypothetical protein
LEKLSATVKASPMIGSTPSPANTDGHPVSSTSNGTGSAITTSAKAPNGETGSALGLTGALAPKSAREAEEMAVALTGDLLPPSVQSWLSATEHHKLVAASLPGKHPPAAPTLTAEERLTVAQAVRSLSEVLQPARERGTELEQAITSMFAVMNVYTGDQAKLSLQVAEWCHYLEDFPIYAIPQGREMDCCQQGQAAKRCRLHL